MFSGLSFAGVAQVRTPSGVVPMVKFRMRALTLSGVRLLVAAGAGDSSLTSNTSLGLTGGIVLYAARLSGDVHGVRVTFTPRQAPREVRPDLVLTDLVADQPFATADSLQASGLRVAGG